MAVSEAKKLANRRWDNAHMATMACKVKKDVAERFRALCTASGATVNAALQGYVYACNQTGTIQTPAAALDAPQAPGAALDPETMNAAQAAADAAGESLSAFLRRAIETQAQRDKVLRAVR